MLQLLVRRVGNEFQLSTRIEKHRVFESGEIGFGFVKLTRLVTAYGRVKEDVEPVKGRLLPEIDNDLVPDRVKRIIEQARPGANNELREVLASRFTSAGSDWR